MMPNMNDKMLVDSSLLETAAELMLDATEKIKILTAHSQELNRVYWRLALALGWVDEGDGKIDCDPEDLMAEVEFVLGRIGDGDAS